MSKRKRMKLDPDNPKKGRTDWQRVDSLTDAEVERAAGLDPDAPALSDEELARMGEVPDVKTIRKRLGMTQEEFAECYQLSLATVRDWEQGRFRPDQSARTLLRLIAKIPAEVRSALDPRSKSA